MIDRKFLKPLPDSKKHVKRINCYTIKSIKVFKRRNCQQEVKYLKLLKSLFSG